MSLKFIDIPTPLETADYEALILEISERCQSLPEIVSLYQLGSIKHPGISDLDLLCVFKKGATSELNFRTELEGKELQILTHDLFVADEADLDQTLQLGYFTNPKLISGVEQQSLLSDPNTDFDEDIGRQIALEYMIKMYVSLTVQLTYGVVKLRAFLLEAKAIGFDLKLLGIEGGRLSELVEEILQIRQTWFEENHEPRLKEILVEFQEQLEQSLSNQLRVQPLLVSNLYTRLARNLILTHSTVLEVSFRGVMLPKQLSFLGKRFINFQSRFNQFVFTLPLRRPTEGTHAARRFSVYKRIAEDYAERFPHFSPLTCVLPIYK